MFLCVNAYQPIIFLQQTPIPFAMISKGQSRVWSSLWTNLSLSKGLRMPSRQNSLKLSTKSFDVSWQRKPLRKVAIWPKSWSMSSWLCPLLKDEVPAGAGTATTHGPCCKSQNVIVLYLSACIIALDGYITLIQPHARAEQVHAVADDFQRRVAILWQVVLCEIDRNEVPMHYGCRQVQPGS